MTDDLVKRILRLLMRITGGRPMERLEYRFRDTITNRPVYYYKDYFGRVWMATGAWSLFRVKLPYEVEDER